MILGQTQKALELELGAHNLYKLEMNVSQCTHNGDETLMYYLEMHMSR